MHLARSFTVALTATLAAGCTDATAPPKRVTALYVLESVDGNPLPATFSMVPAGTTTIYWATLNLDAAGNATIAERRRRESGTSQQEQTHTILTDYEITGENIAIGPPCLDDTLADCAPKRVGQITGSTLTLSGGLSDPQSLVFLYRLAVSK